MGMMTLSKWTAHNVTQGGFTDLPYYVSSRSQTRQNTEFLNKAGKLAAVLLKSTAAYLQNQALLSQGC